MYPFALTLSPCHPVTVCTLTQGHSCYRTDHEAETRCLVMASKYVSQDAPHAGQVIVVGTADEPGLWQTGVVKYPAAAQLFTAEVTCCTPSLWQLSASLWIVAELKASHASVLACSTQALYECKQCASGDAAAALAGRPCLATVACCTALAVQSSCRVRREDSQHAMCPMLNVIGSLPSLRQVFCLATCCAACNTGTT